jgi:hypothetical protein
VPFEAPDAHEIGEPLGAPAPLGRAGHVPQAEIDVLRHGHPGKQAVLLEHHPHAIGPVHAPGRRRQPSRTDIEQRGLAAT